MISSGELPEKIIPRIGRRTLLISAELVRWLLLVRVSQLAVSDHLVLRQTSGHLQPLGVG
jgi:hypothetical protein